MVMSVGMPVQEDYYGPAYTPMMSQQNTNTPSASAPADMGQSGAIASHWGILFWAIAFEAIALLLPHVREWLE